MADFGDLTREQGQKVSDTVTGGLILGRDRANYSDLVIDTSSAEYRATEIAAAVNGVFQAIKPDTIKHSFASAPTLQVNEQVDTRVANAESNLVADLPRANNYKVTFSPGINPNIEVSEIVPDNDIDKAVAVILLHRIRSTDSTQTNLISQWNSAELHHVMELARRSLKDFAKQHYGSALRINYDPVARAIVIYGRCVLHNTAVRENSGLIGKPLLEHEVTTARTLLSWPLAAEFDAARHQVNGFAASAFDVGAPAFTKALHHGMALLAIGHFQIIKVTIHQPSGGIATYQYDQFNDPARITVGNQDVIDDQGESDVDGCYYLRRMADGRIWLTTPATTLFRRPVCETPPDQPLESFEEIPFIVPHLPDNAHELSFLLGRPRFAGATMPGLLGDFEHWHSKSYDKGAITHVYAGPAKGNWGITVREIASVTMSLLRSFGIRMQHFVRAVTYLSETLGAGYVMGTPNGGLAAPALRHTMPPLCCYGIEGLAGMDVFGVADYRDFGLAINFTHLPLQVGAATSLAASFWLSALHTEKREAVVEGGFQGGATLEHVASLAGLHRHIDSDLANVGLQGSAPVGEHEYRPMVLAASYMKKHCDSKVTLFLKFIAMYGGNADSWHAGVRTCVGANAHDLCFADPQRSLGNDNRFLALHYSNGAAARRWHLIPQNNRATHHTPAAVGDCYEFTPQETQKATTPDELNSVSSPATDVLPGETYRRRIFMPSQFGSLEHTLMSAFDRDVHNVMDVMEALKLVPGADAVTSDVPTAISVAANTPGAVMTLMRRGDKAGPSRIALSGDIPMALARELTILAPGYTLAPTPGVSLASRIATSPEAMRQASRQGLLSYRTSVHVQLSHSPAQLKYYNAPALLSPESSVVRDRSGKVGAYVTAYAPAAGLEDYPAAIAFAAGPNSRVGGYHDASLVATKEEVAKNNKAPPLIGVTIVDAETVKGASDQFSKIWRVGQLSDDGTYTPYKPTLSDDVSLLDDLATMFDDNIAPKKIGFAEPTNASTVESAPSDKVIGITGYQAMICELLYRGMPEQAYVALRHMLVKTIEDAGGYKGNPPDRKAQHNVPPSTAGIISCSNIRENLIAISLPGVTNKTEPAELAKLITEQLPPKLDNKLGAQVFNSALLETKSGRALAHIADVVRRQAEDEFYYDEIDDISVDLNFLLSSGDPRLMHMVSDVLAYAAESSANVGKDITSYVYSIKEGTEVVGVGGATARALVSMSESISNSKGEMRLVRYTIDGAITPERAITMPLLMKSNAILFFGQLARTWYLPDRVTMIRRAGADKELATSMTERMNTALNNFESALAAGLNYSSGEPLAASTKFWDTIGTTAPIVRGYYPPAGPFEAGVMDMARRIATSYLVKLKLCWAMDPNVFTTLDARLKAYRSKIAPTINEKFDPANSALELSDDTIDTIITTKLG